MSSYNLVDKASACFLEGHGFYLHQGLRFFFAPANDLLIIASFTLKNIKKPTM